MSYVRMSDLSVRPRLQLREMSQEHLDKLASEMRADREACEARLLRQHPVAFPLARDAASALRRSLGVNGVPSGIVSDPVQYPRWLDDVSPAIDACGRPYVRVMLSQWQASGEPRRGSSAPDGEVPELPKKVNGIPLVVDVSTCFGRPICPGERGVPCVDPPEPAKRTANSGLGDTEVLWSVTGAPATAIVLGVVTVAGFGIGGALYLVGRWLRAK